MNNVDKKPEDEAADNEIESPVDGPTPDWMRLATSASSSGSSLTEENTPSWLKSIRAGQGVSKETKPTEPAPAPPQSPTQADDSMSDLERLLAEEGIDLGAVSEERPEGASGMSARDWLISTSSEEIIRNKLGAQPQTEEPASPLPPPAAALASDDSMSDLERLLAEEGIDLGAVSEERPEGASGMSTRDWLIATSSEEIIRNKLGVQPQAEEPVAPPPSASFSDDKMVVEEDLPDWLQEIAADEAEAEPPVTAQPAAEPSMTPLPVAAQEDDLLVVEEELPDWLQDIAEVSPAAAAIDDLGPSLPLAQPGSFPPDEDKMVVEEDLPDWLQDIAAEESGAPADQTEPALTDFEAPSPLLQAAPASFTADKMVVEEDLPDWLQDIAEAETATDLALPDQESVTPSITAKMGVEEGLPDWLQDIAEEPVIPAEPKMQPEPDFVAMAPPSLAEDKMIVADDLPDWLREAADEAEIAEQPELPPPPPVVVSADKMVVEEDLPDWLREVETGSAEEVILTQTNLEVTPPDLDEAESDEDLPDWLREVEVSSLQDSLTLPSLKPTTEPPPEEPTFTVTASLTEDELDLLDDEDLPAWLKEAQERDGRETTDAVPRPIAAEFSAPSGSSDSVVEDELPGWLRDVQEEATPLEFEALEPVTETAPADEQMVIEEDLPDWLREEELGIDEPFEPSEPSPELLTEAVADELPDWLQEVQEETLEEVAPLKDETPTPVAVATPSSLSADSMVDEEGLPDWLRDVEEEVESLTAEEPFPAPEPVMAEITTAEMVRVEIAEEEAAVEEAPTEELVEVEAPGPISLPEEPTPTPVGEPLMVAPPAGGIPDWLQKLRQVDEEEPTPVLIAPLPAPAQVVAPRPAPQPAYAQRVAPAPDIPADAEERLKLARTARDKGDMAEAVHIYDSLISRGIYLDKIIEDMQQTIKANPGNYLLFQLMGDAMMRDGRLQSALNAYREALLRL